MESIQSNWAPHRDNETDPVRILEWASQSIGKGLVLATSLGPQSLVILEMASQKQLRFDVALIDTGLLFPETLALAQQVEERYGITIRRVRPLSTLAQQEQKQGKALWLRDPNSCCNLRKVAPMGALLGGYRAWISGLRRDQSPDRKNVQALEWDPSFDLLKISPLVDWTGDRVRAYLQQHQIPYNPLLDRGYRSVGCSPCTSPAGDNDDERAGRWSGHEKTECGLHSRPLVSLKTVTNSGNPSK